MKRRGARGRRRPAGDELEGLGELDGVGGVDAGPGHGRCRGQALLGGAGLGEAVGVGAGLDDVAAEGEAVSTCARASELLSVTQGGADPGRQLITVTRKGSGELQELPASTDAFVWLRLYQLEMEGMIPRGRRQPLWWTLRRPARTLTYHAVHRMFERAGQSAGSSATLHGLRHTAAYRIVEDPQLPLTDVQFVLGHAQLTTTQIYLTPRKEEVIRRLLAHHAEQARQAARRAAPPPAPGYRPETLQVLFGTAGS